MAERDKDWHRQYSPNPDFKIGQPDNETPDEMRGRLYDYHKRAGSLALFYDMFPRNRGDDDRER
jgi:hypothetical protein